jgi:hypothetical protein
VRQAEREGRERVGGWWACQPGGRAGGLAGARAGTCHAGCCPVVAGWLRHHAVYTLLPFARPSKGLLGRPRIRLFFLRHAREREGNARRKHEVHDGLALGERKDVGQLLSVG